MYVPQDSETTSLEVIFRSKGRQAWNFTSKKDNVYARKSHYRQNVFLSTKWETEERQVERESRIKWGVCLLNQLPMHH